MQSIKSRAFTNVMLATLCAFSFLANPSKATAQEYFNPHEECDCCESHGNAAWILGGVLVIGGVAVLLSNHSNHGHSGCKGSTGSEGSQGLQGPAGPSFTADIGQSLVFDVTIDAFNTNPTGVTYTVLPFVTAPDGTVFEGTPQTVTTNVANVPLGSIPVSDPLFGIYKVGIAAQNPDNPPFDFDLNVRADVTASRDGSVTTIAQDHYNSNNLTTLDIQSIVDFSYGPADVP